MSSIPFASGTSRKKIVKWTRHKTNFFLIGYPSKYITGCKLFTLRQVFKVLLHEINKPKKNRSTAWFQAEYVVDHALEFWRMAGINTNPKNNCVRRIQKKYKEWCDSAKSKSRIRGVGGKRASFIWELDKFWHIGAKHALATTRENRLLTASDKEENIGFYADQQGIREAVLSGKDKIFKDKFAKKFQRQQPLLTEPSVNTKESKYFVWNQRNG